MTARTTYEAAAGGGSALPTTAGAVRVATNLANAAAAQETIIANASSGLGSSMARGVTAAQDLNIRAAIATYVAAKQKAAMVEQVTIQNAKDVLRSTGDFFPA